jgi:hypothetical protein
MTDLELRMPTGPAAAAFVAAGIGCMAMGVVTVVCEASVAVKQSLDLYAPAGPLTGKVAVNAVAWLVAWAVLHATWRCRGIPLGTAVAGTLGLVVIAFAATFSPFFQLAER